MYSMPMAFFVLWAVGSAWAFLPLVLLGTRRCVRAPGLRSGALLTVALTLLVLAGHPETALHVVAVGAVYGVFELLMQFIPRLSAAKERDQESHRAEEAPLSAVVPVTSRFARRKLQGNLRAAILTALAAGVLALLICAIYILPILEAAPQTMEHAFRVGGWRALSNGVKHAQAGA